TAARRCWRRSGAPSRCRKRREVLVEVRAAALNDTGLWPRQGSCGTPGDPDALAGWRGPVGFPRIRGADVAGVVVSAGTELVGRRVVLDPAIDDAETPDANPAGLMGSERDGGYAEYVTAPARRVHDVADSPLSDVRLAALPTAYGTAPGMTRARRGPRGRHRRGDRCLGGRGPGPRAARPGPRRTGARGQQRLHTRSGTPGGRPRGPRPRARRRRAGADGGSRRSRRRTRRRGGRPRGRGALLLREGADGSSPALSADTPSRSTCAASGLHTPGSSGRASHARPRRPAGGHRPPSAGPSRDCPDPPARPGVAGTGGPRPTPPRRQDRPAPPGGRVPAVTARSVPGSRGRPEVSRAAPGARRGGSGPGKHQAAVHPAGKRTL